MPDPAKVIATVRRAAELSRATPGRSGGVVAADADEVLVMGDLHGNLPAFRQLLPIADLSKNPGRHLVLQELVHGPLEYPDDGGDRSHQLVDVVAALIGQYPGRVHLILGNHELSELTGRPIIKAGVPLNEPFRRGLETAYGDKADAVRAAYLDLFAALPLAVRAPNRVLCCHTVPDGYGLDRFDPGILAAATWSDAEMARGGSVYAITWGRDTSPETADRFAAMVDADLFVCGHQPQEEGFRQANHRVLIIDGTDPNPTYCQFAARSPATMEALLAGVRRLPMASS